MSKTKNTELTDKQKQDLNDQLQRELQAAIELAVNIRGAFELYGYRIITPEDYLHEVDRLVQQCLNTTKK